MSGTGLGTGGWGEEVSQWTKHCFRCQGDLVQGEGWRWVGEADFKRAADATEGSQGRFLGVPCLSWDPLACSCIPSAWTYPSTPGTKSIRLPSSPYPCPGPLTSWSLFSVSEAIGICSWHFFLIFPGLVLSSMKMTSERMSLSPSFVPELHCYLPAGSSPLEVLLSQTLAHLEHGIFLLNPSSWDNQRSWAGAGENAGLLFFFFCLFK